MSGQFIGLMMNLALIANPQPGYINVADFNIINPHEGRDIFIPDEYNDQYEYHNGLAGSINSPGRYDPAPRFNRAFNFWHEEPTNTSFDWYLANVVGNVYPNQHQGVLADINGDGYTDQVYLTEINPGGYYDNRIQFISIWLNYGSSYQVYNDKLRTLYSGIVVDNGQILLVNGTYGTDEYRIN